MFALSGKNSQHEIIAENVSNGILLESFDRKVQYVNNLFLDIFKIPIPQDALIGTDCRQAANYASFLFIDPYAFLLSTESHLKGGVKVINEELTMTGGRVLLRDYIPFYDEGCIAGHLWMYKEITTLKQLERESEKLKFFYERILDNIPVDIAVFDTAQRLLYINRNANEDDGIRKLALGKTEQDYYAWVKENKRIEELRKDAFFKAVITGKNTEYTELSVFVDGTTRYYLRSFFPLMDVNNELEVIIRYGVNITSLVEKEQELEQINKKLGTLISTMDEAMVILDLELIIEFVNPSWTRIFGFDEEFSIGKHLGDFFDDAQLKIIQDEVSGAATVSLNNKKRRFTCNNKYRTYIVVDCFVNSFKDGQNTKYSILFTDVTAEERGLAELKLIVEKERNLNQLKSDFVNMVSHELRTPLSVIQSSAEICEMMVEKSTSFAAAQLKEYLGNITGEVGRITQLLSEVLLVSKIESGKIRAIYEEIDLKHFLSEIIEKNFTPWRDGRVIEAKFLTKLKNQIFADSMMLRHIFQNLLENAFKYSLHRPSPICRVKITDRWWSFTIVDFGIGIPAAECNKLSQPFFRANNVGNIGGTGLGLAVVSYFLGQLKGSFFIRSAVNKGSIFYLKFKNEQDPGN